MALLADRTSLRRGLAGRTRTGGSMKARTVRRSWVARLLRAGRRLTALAVVTALLVLGIVADAMGEKIPEDDVASKVSTATSSQVVVDWSRIVVEAAMTDDGFVSFMGTRHQVMMHVAMHDALNAIDPRV